METAELLRQALASESGISEKKMFGGVCFLRNGNMLAGTGKQGHVLFRVGKDAQEAALRRPGAEPMIHGGRKMDGFIWVDAVALRGDGLNDWLDLARSYVAALPPKSETVKKRKRRGK